MNHDWKPFYNEIITRYDNGESSCDIAKSFNANQHSIGNIIARIHTPRTKSEASTLAVKKGKKDKAIKALILSSKTYNRFIPRNAHKGEQHYMFGKHISEEMKNKRIITLDNKTLFYKDVLKNNPWCLGLLSSDGNITSKNNIRKFSVSGNYDTISKFHKLFNTPTIKIGKHKNSECFRVEFYNKSTVEWLIRIGITPNKSLTIQYPDIPDDFDTTRNFIRGVFDGDGCVYNLFDKKKNKGFLKSCIVSASKPFLDTIKIKLKQFNIETSNIRKATRCWRLDIQTRNCVKFYHFIYDNLSNELFNKTKRDRFDEIIKMNGVKL